MFKEHIIQIIDFSLANFISIHWPRNSSHVRNIKGKSRYVNINTHLGMNQSRRDDLESIGHMLMYFLRGSLPWQLVKDTNRRKIGKTKQKTIPVLINKFPFQRVTLYLKFTRQIDFFVNIGLWGFKLEEIFL